MYFVVYSLTCSDCMLPFRDRVFVFFFFAIRYSLPATRKSLGFPFFSPLVILNHKTRNIEAPTQKTVWPGNPRKNSPQSLAQSR
jgi:hypothetical protein